MTFQNSIPLALVIAVPLVPLLLYLLTRRRVPVVALATFRFLLASPSQRPRRTRWLEVLLLVARVAFVVGVLVLLARPTSSGPVLVQEANGRDVVLLVDCSASMGRTGDGTTLFTKAKEAATALAAKLAPTERVTLVAVTGQPQALLASRTVASVNLAEQIDALRLSPGRANLYAALRDHVPTPSLVYFFTDAQANSFQELDATRPPLPDGSAFVLVDVGGTMGANVAVRGDIPSMRAIVGLPLDFAASVTNHADHPADVVLTLTMNEREVERHALHLGPHETRRQTFAPFLPTTAGVLRGQFAITSTTDTFADDNRFAFALAVEPQVPVLLVNGRPSDDPYENETLYIQTALRTERGATDPRRGPTLDVTEEAESAWHGLDETQLAAKLAKYAVIVLANCGGLQQANPNAYVVLRNYVENGGGLLIAPGDRVLAHNYNSAFFPVPLPSKDQLTPARLAVQPVGDVEVAETFRSFSPRVPTHPLFALFQRDTKAKYFDGIRIKRHWPLQLPPTHRATVLAEYPDRSPAIVENRFGDGQVLLLSFPLNSRWSNFPLHGAEFVPFLLQAITHLQRRGDVEGPRVVAADTLATFSVADAWTPLQGRVTDPRGRVHPLTFERFGGRQQAPFPNTPHTGYYTATLTTVGGPHTATWAFAVNTDAVESEPIRFSAEQVQAFFPAATIITDTTPYTPQERWRWVVYVLLALFAVEMALALWR